MIQTGSIIDELEKLQEQIGVGQSLDMTAQIAHLLEQAYYECGQKTDVVSRVMASLRLPRQRSYQLGSIETMLSEGHHRIVRKDRGKKWLLYVNGVDFLNGEELVGEYTSEDILYEVEGLGYDVSLSNWILMGWRL